MQINVTGPLDDQAFRWSLEVPPPRDRSLLAAELRTRVDAIAVDGGGKVQLWLPEVHDAEDDVVAELGFEAYRDLWQLRVDLPARKTDLVVRGFTPDDAEAFLRVNNRAFAWHPEQGNMTPEGLAERQAEPWYDPEGFLLYYLKDELGGFCWTKFHHDMEPPTGEIYAIAIDPDFQGRGLGRALTLRGLMHMADHGLTQGMLYVEADNHPANAIYEAAGFRYHHTNRAYSLTLDS